MVPLTGGRIGRKVVLGVLSRGHEIPFGGRPACGRLRDADLSMVLSSQRSTSILDISTSRALGLTR